MSSQKVEEVELMSAQWWCCRLRALVPRQARPNQSLPALSPATPLSFPKACFR